MRNLIAGVTQFCFAAPQIHLAHAKTHVTAACFSPCPSVDQASAHFHLSSPPDVPGRCLASRRSIWESGSWRKRPGDDCRKIHVD